MAKTKKRGKQTAVKTKTTKGKKQHSVRPQTNHPFEQDAKRRIGQYGGAGEPPIVK